VTSFIDSGSPPNGNQGIKSAGNSEARPSKQKLSGQQAQFKFSQAKQQTLADFYSRETPLTQ
jgi:hypothetical protein